MAGKIPGPKTLLNSMNRSMESSCNYRNPSACNKHVKHMQNKTVFIFNVLDVWTVRAGWHDRSHNAVLSYYLQSSWTIQPLLYFSLTFFLTCIVWSFNDRQKYAAILKIGLLIHRQDAILYTFSTSSGIMPFPIRLIQAVNLEYPFLIQTTLSSTVFPKLDGKESWTSTSSEGWE